MQQHKIKIVPKIKPVIWFCCPGHSFSKEFLTCWSNTLNTLGNEYEIGLSTDYDANVYYVRSKCLMGNVLKGKNQPVLQGHKYDYIMWIDSDIIFNPQQILKLISYKLDIVSGIYMMSDGKNFATVEQWDEEYFRKTGAFKFMTEEDIATKSGLFEVAYTGFGFLLIKQGVFETVKYPWFRPKFYNLGNDIEDFASEDVSFCRNAIEAGFKIYVDPKIRVGHKKQVIL